MKPTTDGRWVHIGCVVQTDNAYILDTTLMAPVCITNADIQASSTTGGALREDDGLSICMYCKQAAGGLVNCDHEDGCAKKFHWYCGWKAGAHLFASEHPSFGANQFEAAEYPCDLKHTRYCTAHSKQLKAHSNKTQAQLRAPHLKSLLAPQKTVPDMTDAYDWSQSLHAAVQEGITLPTAQTAAETRAAAVAASDLNDCNLTATAISINAAAEASEAHTAKLQQNLVQEQQALYDDATAANASAHAARTTTGTTGSGSGAQPRPVDDDGYASSTAAAADTADTAGAGTAASSSAAAAKPKKFNGKGKGKAKAAKAVPDVTFKSNRKAAAACQRKKLSRKGKAKATVVCSSDDGDSSDDYDYDDDDIDN
eukprot:10740-Heterococcus_DN1.PRE.1